MPNSEAKQLSQRLWRQKNKETQRIYAVNYYYKNKERLGAIHREYLSRPEIKERARTKYVANRESIRIKQRAYCKTMPARYNHAVRIALKRGLDWKLSFDAYSGLLKSDECHYCFGSISGEGVGLDRINHDDEYTTSNVLPCCPDCNRHRQDNWSVKNG